MHIILILSFVICANSLCKDYSEEINSDDEIPNSESNEVFNNSPNKKPERIKPNITKADYENEMERKMKNVTFGANNKEHREAKIEVSDVEKGKVADVPKISNFINQTVLANWTLDNCKDQESRSAGESDERCRNTLINYPFAASIQKKGSHYATGALVSRAWILTAAAEFFTVRETIKLFRARLGSVDCKKGGTLLALKRIDIHPLFVYGKPSYDVALIRLSVAVEVTEYIKPIAVSNIQAKVLSARFLTVYWPRLIVKGKILPPSAKERVKFNSMRVSRQKMIAWEKCEKMMQVGNAALDKTSLCLKPIVTHHSVCMPDVGAPVLADDGLWGISSGWTWAQCPALTSPTVFTRISSTPVRSWLNAVIGAQ